MEVRRRRGRLAVAAALALAALAARGAAGDLSSCSRVGSDAAAAVIAAEVQPEVDRLGYALPPNCPLDAARDYFGVHRGNTKRMRRREYKCKLCGKTFVEESFVARHQIAKHADRVPDDPLCLADYCDVLGCEKAPAVRKCDPEDMRRREAHCNLIVHRCFDPTHGGVELELHDALTARLCEPLRCSVNGGAATTRGDGAAAKEAERSQRLYYILVGFLVAILAVYYGVYFLVRSETRHRADLTRLSTTRQASRLQFWRSSKPKAKLY